MKNIRNKKGQVYMIAVIITIVFALISSFILINYASSQNSTDKYIGVYQSGMINAILDGDRTLMYLEGVAKYSSSVALQDFAENGGTAIYDSNGQEKPTQCKTYVYNLWNSESAECYPNYGESMIQYMYKSIMPRLQSNPDINLQKEMPYEFKYSTPSIEGTTISALSNTQYEYYVFKSREYRNDPTIQKYIDNKITYSDGTSYTVGSGNCQDIANFADKYIGVSWSRNIVPQPPDVAMKTGLQCGAFVSSVFKFGSSITTPLGDGNEKCYNFKTDTVSPTLELLWQRKTDYKCITSISCMTGLQSLTDKELDDIKLEPGDIFSATTPTSYGAPHGHTGIYVGKGRLENPKSGSSWVYLKFIPDPNGKHVAIHSGVGYSYISDLEVNDRKMIAFCRHKGCITDKNPVNAINCQVKENVDWKISTFLVSKSEVSGEDTITITTTIENPGVECASVKAVPVFLASGQDTYEFDAKKMTDVYKDNQGKIYRNIETVCSFVTDKNKLASERGPDKCVLLAPTDDTKIEYTLRARALDTQNRPDLFIPPLKKFTFTVTKPATNPSSTPSTPSVVYPVDDFMKGNYAAVKKNMEKYKVIESAIRFSQENNVPSELVLGKLTQESSGIPGQKTGEAGLGGGLGQTTFSEFKTAKWAKPLRDKGCKTENFLKTDQFSVDCQVEATILHLLDKKKSTDNNQWYENAVKNSCKDPAYQKIYLSYPEKGWERALRAYNGFGCKIIIIGKSNIEPWRYVDKVMGYAALWGYSGAITQISQYKQVAVDEIEGKGIIGKYYINPSFTVKIPFDMSLIDNLSMFMNQTSNECRVSDLGKEPCLDSKIAEYNAATGAKYKTLGVKVELTRNCDDSSDEKAFNEFIESVEDCAMSPDFDCQCDLTQSGPASALKINIESMDDSAKFSFTKSGITYDVESYNKFLDVNNDPLKLSGAINTISIYKKLGYLKSGVTQYKKCSIPESKFRLCLKTDYYTEEYNGRSLEEKNVTIKFAITIKDNDAPPPLTSVALSNMRNSKNSVIVSWNESKKNGIRVPDVASYNIYLSDIAIEFNSEMKNIRKTTNYRTLDILKTGYDKIQSIDLSQEPKCEIIDNNYCIFNYTAKSSSGADVQISLLPNKLYYIMDTERFFYILNGSESYNALNSGRDTYIAVTAVDTDGNEINNVNATEKITLGQNLQNIKPVDNLAPGFVQMTATTDTITKKIYLSYQRPEFYINGEAMDNAAILYRAYTDWDSCGQDQNNQDFCNVKVPFAPKAETGVLTMDVDMMLVGRIGVITTVQKNNMDAQYLSAFTQTII